MIMRRMGARDWLSVLMLAAEIRITDVLLEVVASRESLQAIDVGQIVVPKAEDGFRFDWERFPQTQLWGD